jgi:hypothetical protein
LLYDNCSQHFCHMLTVLSVLSKPGRPNSPVACNALPQIKLLGLCKIWGFHGGDYEECRLLGYKTTVRTSQETHYVSVTESIQLMLCQIWGFHGSDYEECRLLGYKNPVRTSQQTHYVSTTESSWLMLC